MSEPKKKKKITISRKILFIILGIIGLILILISVGATIFNSDKSESYTVVETEPNEFGLIRNYNTNNPVANNTLLRISHSELEAYLTAIGFTSIREVEFQFRGNDVKAWEAQAEPYSDLPVWDFATILVQDNQVETASISLVYAKPDANLDLMYQDISSLSNMFNGFTFDKSKLKESLDEARNKFNNDEEETFGANEFKVGNVLFTIEVNITKAFEETPELYEVRLIQINLR